MTRVRWKWFCSAEIYKEESNALSSTRVNIEKNNFLRDYFNSISFFFYDRISLHSCINILHEVSLLYIYNVGGGGWAGGGGKIRTKLEL